MNLKLFSTFWERHFQFETRVPAYAGVDVLFTVRVTVRNNVISVKHFIICGFEKCCSKSGKYSWKNAHKTELRLQHESRWQKLLTSLSTASTVSHSRFLQDKTLSRKMQFFVCDNQRYWNLLFMLISSNGWHGIKRKV